MDLRKRDWENIKLAIGIVPTSNCINGIVSSSNCINCESDTYVKHTKSYIWLKNVLVAKDIGSSYEINNALRCLEPSFIETQNEEERGLFELFNIDADKARNFLEYVVKLKDSSCGGDECPLRYEYIELLSSYCIPDIHNYLYAIYKVNDSNELRQIILNAQPDANLNWIDVSDVSDFSYLFSDKSDFNGDISLWNVVNAVNMEGMFNNCTEFNCNINSWWVNNAVNMKDMFNGCKQFNQDISNWSIDNAVTKNIFTDCGIEESNKPNPQCGMADSDKMVDAEYAAKELQAIVVEHYVSDAYSWRIHFANYFRIFTTVAQCFKSVHYDSDEFWNCVKEFTVIPSTSYLYSKSIAFFNGYLEALICLAKTINSDAFGRQQEVMEMLASLCSRTKVTSHTQRSLHKHYITLLNTDPKPLYRMKRLPYNYALLKLDLTKYIARDAMTVLCDKLYKEPLYPNRIPRYDDYYDQLVGPELSNRGMHVVDYERKKLHKAMQRSILKTSDNIISVKELCGLFNRHAKSPNKKPILLVYGKNDPYTIFYTSNTAESRKIETVKSDGNSFVFAPKYFDTPFVFYNIGRFFQPEAQEIKYAEWMADNCGDHTFFWVLHREFEIPESVKSKFDVYYIE